MERFRKRRGWRTQARSAQHFRLKPSTYSMAVRGLKGFSVQKAEKIARRSQGEFSAWDLLRWHDRHRPQSGDDSGGAAAAGAR